MFCDAWKDLVMDILFYLFLFALLILAIAAGVWVVKGYLNGQSPASAIFGPRPERRLGVIEQANVDGRRRLLLIKRDDVEHLIMTGGPVDVVIETGIGERRDRSSGSYDGAAAAQTVFTRQPRSFGQATAQSGTERAAE
jgi:flagellar protein FliO/FliZ